MEKLEEHLYCEFKYGSGYYKPLVKEERGRIPMLDEYMEIFNNILMANVNNGNNSIVINKNIFSGIDNCFFDKCEIEVKLIKNAFTDSKGGYYPMTSENDILNNKMKFLVIDLEIYGPTYNECVDEAIITFSHELTHAYEDYERLVNGRQGIDSEAENIGYYDMIEAINNGVSGLSAKIAGIMYEFNKSERNAHLSELYAELCKMNYSTSSEAFNAIRQTTPYSTYENVKNAIEYINSVLNVADERTANMFRERFFLAFKTILPKSRQSTWKGAINFLNRKFYKYEKKFLDTASKMAYDAYLKRTKAYDKGITNNKVNKILNND